jgi:hypothetical protein
LILGFFVSLIVGGAVTSLLFEWGRWRIKKSIKDDALEQGLNEDEIEQRLNKKLPKRKGSVPGWAMGLLERFFFTSAVAVAPPAAIAAMPVWLGIKLAANWQRKKPTKYTRSASILAVAIGLVAMLFSLIGGLLCREYFGVIRLF